MSSIFPSKGKIVWARPNGDESSTIALPAGQPMAAPSRVASAMKHGRPVQGYLPTLDGWRALAILAVIQYHDGLHKFGRFSNSLFHEQGSLGVDLFFAISGFLICSRLLDENRKGGSISLRNFYIRRCFRIMPAAWVYLTVCAVLSLMNVIPQDWGGLLSSLLMVRNLWIVHAGDTPAHWYTIHFWSLSVEEHFYLLLPGLLVLLARRRMMITGAIAALTTLWTLTIYHVLRLQTPAVWLRTDERLSALMVPAFFAVLISKDSIRAAVIRWLRPWVAFLAFALLYFAGGHIRSVAPLVTIVGFPLVVISAVYHPLSWTGRLLELRILKFVGRISYSLYLWQQIFFLMGHQGASWPLSAFQHGPMNYLGAFAFAVMSYYFVEKPLIRIGHRTHPLQISQLSHV